MSRRFAIATGLAIAVAASAQISDLAELRERRNRIGQASDSLMSVRVRLVARRDSLSMRADSLWSQDPETAELVQTRSEFRVLEGRLRHIELQNSRLVAAADSVEERLRDTYDWEISRLHGLLTEEGWDEGLFRQLRVFQEERETLGSAIPAASERLNDEHELSVTERDGPEEIQQKIELAQDKIALLQRTQREIERRLLHLDREVRLIRHVWHLSREIDLQLQLRDRGGGDYELVSPSTQPDGPTLSAAPAPPDTVTSAPIEAPLLLEAQRLKARLQELRDVEAFLQARIGVFHERLTHILEGRE